MTPTCLFCGLRARSTSDEQIFLHAPSDCTVRVLDRYGSSLDHLFEVEGDTIYIKEIDPTVFTPVRVFTPIEVAMNAMFDLYGLPRLGGSSGVDGWSSTSSYQRCPYAWARDQGLRGAPQMAQLSVSDYSGRSVGSLVHGLLSVYYSQRIDLAYPLSPELLFEGVKLRGIDPAVAVEAHRLYRAYVTFYKHERLTPLFVEYLLVASNPRRSCRNDLIALVEGDPAHPPGLYIVDHKTASRFDELTLTCWENEGGIIQQVDVFEAALPDHPALQSYGPLQGVIVNLIGKQKAPELYRAYVHPTAFQVDQHRRDLPVWRAQRDLALALGVFPRARAGCATRFGKCDHWDHCRGDEA